MHETSIVLELQRLALEPNSSTSDLLRKAMLVATKLSLDEFKDWVSKELNGYNEGDLAPAYRRCKASLFWGNGPFGDLPLQFADTDIGERLRTAWLSNPISELEEQARHTGGSISFDFSEIEIKYIFSCFKGRPAPTSLRKVIPLSAVHGIVDAVKTTVLDWSLKLEKDGILGEGLSFTPAEKEKASHTQVFNIGTLYGVAEAGSKNTITQTFTINIEKGDTDALVKMLEKEGVPAESLVDLRKSIVEDGEIGTTGHFGKSVSKWLGEMTQKAASGVWKVGIEVATGTLTGALLKYYGLQ